VDLSFNGEIWFWRGPSPFHFVTVPEGESGELHDISSLVSYGWGVLPVVATIGRTCWKTSLFPKDGGFVVPLKAAVRKAEVLALGDTVQITLEVTIAH